MFYIRFICLVAIRFYYLCDLVTFIWATFDIFVTLSQSFHASKFYRSQSHRWCFVYLNPRCTFYVRLNGKMLMSLCFFVRCDEQTKMGRMYVIAKNGSILLKTVMLIFFSLIEMTIFTANRAQNNLLNDNTHRPKNKETSTKGKYWLGIVWQLSEWDSKLIT